MKHEVRSLTPVRRITITAMFMGLNIVLSTFSVPVPGGHFYLNDIAISTAALLLDPFSAFIAGGVGAFLADFFFYPAPMFVSLVAHGLQAFLISYFVHRASPDHKLRGAVIGTAVGSTVDVIVYSLGRAFVYATPAAAIAKLPYAILSVVLGSAVAILLCFRFGLNTLFQKLYIKK